MSKYTKLNNEGFSTVEALLLVVIVAIIVFVGWFVYHSNQQANKTIDTANQSNSNAQVLTTSSTKTSEAAGTRAKEIATILLNYNKSNSTNPLKDYVDIHVNDGQFTKAFKTAVDNGTALVASSTTSNPVYCSGTKAPNGFKVASTTMTTGDSDTVSLTQVITGSSSANVGPNVTLTYANGTWSIDQYACQ
jgi:hypothetical protein